MEKIGKIFHKNYINLINANLKYSEMQNNVDNIGTVILIPNLKKGHGVPNKILIF